MAPPPQVSSLIIPGLSKHWNDKDLGCHYGHYGHSSSDEDFRNPGLWRLNDLDERHLKFNVAKFTTDLESSFSLHP